MAKKVKEFEIAKEVKKLIHEQNEGKQQSFETMLADARVEINELKL